jgi:hypothetical protein
MISSADWANEKDKLRQAAATNKRDLIERMLLCFNFSKTDEFIPKGKLNDFNKSRSEKLKQNYGDGLMERLPFIK